MSVLLSLIFLPSGFRQMYKNIIISKDFLNSFSVCANSPRTVDPQFHHRRHLKEAKNIKVATHLFQPLPARC